MRFVVVGGGPCGIFTSLLLCEKGHEVVLIEQHDVLGGCHRVDRDENGLFSEHGPRIYLTNYVNYSSLLERYGLSFDDWYVKYNYGLISTGLSTAMRSFKLHDCARFVAHYAHFVVNPSYYRQRSVESVLGSLSPNARQAVDSMCNLTDGGGIERYTAHSFFNLINQNALYRIVQPKQANDRWLWSTLEERLVSMGASVIRATASSVGDDGVRAVSVRCDTGEEVSADAVVLCTPPKATETILSASSSLVATSTSMGDRLKEYAEFATYETYVSFTVHFEAAVEIKKQWGGRQLSDWNVGWIVMSDYIRGETPVMVSVTIYELDKRSSTTNLTANETEDADSLLQEGTRQLLQMLGVSERPRSIILNPRVFRKDGRWHTEDMPFMRTPKVTAVSCRTKLENLFWVGPHNLENRYDFTSMENVCENVIHFCNTVLKMKLRHKRAWSMNQALFLVLTAITVAVLLKKSRRRGS